MARPPRIQFEGAYYHVFSRGNRRGRIFYNEEDYASFEAMMLEAMRWSGVQLFNWSQMPNHFHFNVATPEGNLSQFMHRLLTRYAQYFNRTYRFVGHLFQGRYGARLVDQENHFQEIARYVELNAYRVKGKPLAALGQWKWSSLRYYLKPEDQWPEGCRSAFRNLLQRFGNDPILARKQFSAFLSDGLEKGRWDDFYKVKDRRFIGEEDFIERAKARGDQPVRNSSRSLDARLRIEEILARLETVSGLTPQALRAPGKGRRISLWRHVLVYIARTFYRTPVVRLSRVLGRNPSTISMMLARSWKTVGKWPETELMMNALKQKQVPAEVKCDM